MGVRCRYGSRRSDCSLWNRRLPDGRRVPVRLALRIEPPGDGAYFGTEPMRSPVLAGLGAGS